jgi:putative phosphoesterase
MKSELLTPSSKLGIISDTHGLLNETILAVGCFREHGVQTIIHCGDIGGSAVAQAFQEIETHFVLGNMDSDSENLRLDIEATGNHLHGWFGSIERAGKRIAFLHGHQSDKFGHELENGNWDLICYGHTHVAALQMHNSTMLLNPGAFKRVFRPTIAIVTLPGLTVERFDV